MAAHIACAVLGGLLIVSLLVAIAATLTNPKRPPKLAKLKIFCRTALAAISQVKARLMR